MDIQLKGVRKKSRNKFEIELMGIMRGKRFYFWRTSSNCLTREFMEKAGINVNKYGAETRQLTFYRIRK